LEHRFKSKWVTLGSDLVNVKISSARVNFLEGKEKVENGEMGEMLLDFQRFRGKSMIPLLIIIISMIFEREQNYYLNFTIIDPFPSFRN